MDGEQLKTLINNKLISYDMAELDAYPLNTQKQLCKIEAYIQQLYQIKTAYESLKLNISSIATETHIARQTIYNKPELEMYIQNNQKDFEQNNPNLLIKQYQLTIQELNHKLSQLYERDLNTQLLMDEVDTMQSENKSLLRELQRCNQNNVLLSKRIEELEKKLRQKNSVVNLHDKQ